MTPKLLDNDSASGTDRLFEDALKKTLSTIGYADRFIIFYQSGSDREFKARASHGVERERVFVDAPLSMSSILKVHESGSPELVTDVQSSPEKYELSLVLSGIFSYLCVPFSGPSGANGVLYADSLNPRRLFSIVEQQRMKSAAHDLGERLRGLGDEPGPTLKAPEPHRPQVRDRHMELEPLHSVNRQPPTQQPVPESEAQFQTISGADQVVFFQSLATLFAAGIPLTRALETMAGGQTAYASVCKRILSSLLTGHTLSKSMRLQGRCFSETQLRMVEVGEVSGRLHLTLSRIADWAERSLRRLRKIKSTLTYPAILFCICLLLVIFIPPYVLEGQFQLLRDSGVEIPLLTKGLMALSDFIRSPFVVVALAGFVVGTGFALSRAWRNNRARMIMILALREIPGVGRVVRTLGWTQFCHSLSTLLDVGVPWMQALPLAGGTTGDPILEMAAKKAAEEMRAGASVGDSLDSTGELPPTLIAFAQAGEQSGCLDETLARAGELYDMESEAALEALATLLEPVIMMVMGIVVCLFVVGTLVPMSQALGSL